MANFRRATHPDDLRVAGTAGWKDDYRQPKMWIFAYGSLMFDGWEAACGCIDRKWADLPCYRRSFNKKSIERHGTREVPGLTLNLVRAPGHVCRGVAFAFEDNDRHWKYYWTFRNEKPASHARLPFSLRTAGRSPSRSSFTRGGI